MARLTIENQLKIDLVVQIPVTGGESGKEWTVTVNFPVVLKNYDENLRPYLISLMEALSKAAQDWEDRQDWRGLIRE